MNFKKILFFSIVIVIAGCKQINQGKRHKEIPELDVIRLEPDEINLENGYVAEIQAVQNVEIRSKIQGYLEKIYVDEGKSVVKGQPLFQLNDQQFQLDLAKARSGVAKATAEVHAAELEMKRIQLLVDKKIISVTELELAGSKLKGAKAHLNEAKAMEEEAALRASYSLIRAPFNGVLDRIPLKLGSLVSQGDLLTTVSDLSEVFAYFKVSENEYLDYMRKLKAKQKESDDNVKLILSDGTVYGSTGKIETMEGEFDPGTGSIAFRARFPNPERILKHGSTGKVTITTRLKNALKVPQEAVFDIQDKNYVFVVEPDSTVKMHSFIPRTKIDHFFIVQSGLEEGDKIVFEGVQNLRDGMHIRPQLINADSLTAAVH